MACKSCGKSGHNSRGCPQKKVGAGSISTKAPAASAHVTAIIPVTSPRKKRVRVAAAKAAAAARWGSRAASKETVATPIVATPVSFDQLIRERAEALKRVAEIDVELRRQKSEIERVLTLEPVPSLAEVALP